jgi:hypothetical protein
MQFSRFKARVDTIVKLCCALLSSVKLCYAINWLINYLLFYVPLKSCSLNFEIADIMLLLILRTSTKPLHLWLQDTIAAREDHEFPNILEHNYLSERGMMIVSLRMNTSVATYKVAMIEWYRSRSARDSLCLIGDCQSVWGSLASVQKPYKACQSLIKACQFVVKHNKACKIFMPGRSKS